MESRKRIDLSGDWKFAMVDYYSLDLPVGAALAAIRLGDQLSVQGDYPAALHWYRQASEIWYGAAEAVRGTALALYRQAEANWRMQEERAARQALEEALVELDHCSPSLQANGRSAIFRASKMLDKEGAKRWPVYDWQAYDDDFCISVLFHA